MKRRPETQAALCRRPGQSGRVICVATRRGVWYRQSLVRKEEGVSTRNLYAVILAGGKGERFWPLSRAARPKQLLPLAGKHSLLRQTVSRVRSVVPPERIFVITSSGIERRVRSELNDLRGINVVGEPLSRNTAPALALASFLISRRSPDAICAVLPSDHVVGNRTEFLRNLKQAARAADRGSLVVFGVKPTRAETGYGYVHAGGRESSLGPGVLHVKRFVEKPDRRTAVKFMKSGEHYWNSGMFVWRADVFLEGVRKHMPELHADLARFERSLGKKTRRAALKEFYLRVDAESIDYGLLEKSRNIAMVKADFPWDDLGSWASLERIRAKDRNGNISHGRAVALDTTDCVLFSRQGLVATLGVRDLVVVRTEDVTLVCSREMVQEVKRISRALSASGRLKKFL